MTRLAIFILASYLTLCSPASGQTEIITTVAGNGTGGFSGDKGPATSAELQLPYGIAVNASGDLFIADTDNGRIREVSSSGIITTLVGSGGLVASPPLYQPRGVFVDSSGNVFIADTGNGLIRKVAPGGTRVATVAGSGTTGYTGDGGPATSAQLAAPQGVAVDASGNIFIADTFNNVIRKVAGGTITTVAGDNALVAGFSGDNGPATSAQLNNPTGVFVDASGNLYIADRGNNRVRKVSTSGTITTIAGTSGQGYSGDGGPATSAALYSPSSVAVDSSGNIYIAVTISNRIREISGGIITTVAGNGAQFFAGDDGPATSAALNYPGGITLDASGDLFIADTGNNRIREVSPSASFPVVPANGVAEGAGFSALVSVGGIGSIFGTNLATGTTTATTLPLLTTLGGTTVTMNGNPVPLFYVSPLQINFQVPWELPASSPVSLDVSTANGTSSAITVSLSPAAPGIFTINTTNSASQGAIQIANSNPAVFVAPVGAISGVTSRPAKPGDDLTIFCSGLGAVTNTPADGSPGVSGSNLSNVQAAVSVTIGGQTAPFLFAGLAPGFVGLYQVNVMFPATGVTSGSAVPVIVTTQGLSSNIATIAVQ